MSGKEILERDGWTMKFSGTIADANFLRSKAESIAENGRYLAIVVMDGPTSYALMIRPAKQAAA